MLTFRPRLPPRYVAKVLPPVARDLLVEAAAVEDEEKRLAAIESATAMAKQLYPQHFNQEQQA